MAVALSHGAAVRIAQLQTPAGLYVVSESEDVWGGRTFTTDLVATVWGDFRPDVPQVSGTSDGDHYVVQAADFLCRSAQGAAPGGLLRLKGFDWRIVSIDELADGTVRFQLERVHG